MIVNGGYIERKPKGVREGILMIDGVELSPIEGMYFKKEDTGEDWLWLKRKPLLEYDAEMQKFNQRPRKPQWETYLKKVNKGNGVAYRGTFVFLRFIYEITGIWDNVLGKDKERLNLYVERLPMKDQTMLINHNEKQ